MDKSKVRIDGVEWYIGGRNLSQIQPLCPKHQLRLYNIPDGYSDWDSYELFCEECTSGYRLPRTIAEEKQYILDKLDSKAYKEMKVLNLDDEFVPIAEDKISTSDNRFFVRAILTESKVGKRVVIYAGEKGMKDKAQIFVEPQTKKLSFDQNDMHPSEVFAVIEATFRDGTQHSIKK